MTVQISNTELTNSFNTWRLNTNHMATVISNNVVTVSRAGDANRNAVSVGNGHIKGTFTANEFRTTTLKSGNTSDDGGWLYVRSNTVINATSLAISSNTTIAGNVTIATSGAQVFNLGDISRIRFTGGTAGQYLRKTGTNRFDFETMTLRQISDLSSNSAHIILSGSNATFSDTGDSPKLILANGNGKKVTLYAANTDTSADLHVQLEDVFGDSRFVFVNSTNNVVAYVDSTGKLNVAGRTTLAALHANGAVDFDSTLDVAGKTTLAALHANGNVDVDGTTNLNALTATTISSNGAASLNNVTVTTLVANGAVDFNSDFNVDGAATVNSLTVTSLVANGNVTLGDAATDTITVKGKFANQSTTGTASFNGDVYLGNASTDTITVKGNFANQSTEGAATFNGATVFNDSTTFNGTMNINGDVNVGDAASDTIIVKSISALNGNTTIGDTAADTITVNARFISNLVANGNLDLGTSSLPWRSLYVDNIIADGNIDLGDSSADSLTINAEVDSNIIPDADNGTGQYNLGSSSKRWNISYANTVNTNDLTVNDDATITNNLRVNGNTFIGTNNTDRATINAKIVGGFSSNGSSITIGDNRSSFDTATRKLMHQNGGLTTLNIYANTVFHDKVNLAAEEIVISGTGDLNSLEVSTYSILSGDVTIGSDQTDNLYVYADVSSNLTPQTTSGSPSYNLGDGTGKHWENIYANNVYLNSNIDVDGKISRNGTTVIGSNSKLHANNTITNGTILNAMLDTTGVSATSYGSGTSIPVITVNAQGRITGVTTSSVAGVSNITYTQSNNVITVSTAAGTSVKAPIAAANTTSSTGRGVASFDSDDFSVTSGHVSLKDASTGAVLAINGTTNEVEVSRTNGTVTVGLPDDVTIGGDLTVTGGDIVLSGTGRIQGVDTVTSGTDAANKTYVDTAVANLVDSAPEALNTLNELAAALGDDANFSTTLATNLGQKLGATATVALTGDVTASATAFSSNTVSVSTSLSTSSGATLANYMQVANTNTLVNDRMQVANTVALVNDRMQVANVESYLANTNAWINSNLANTNAWIASNLANTNTWLTASNSAIEDRMQVANTNALINAVNTNLGQRLGATATVALSGDVTASATAFSSNTVTISTNIASNVVGANELNVSGNGTSGQVLKSDGDGSFTWLTLGSLAALSSVGASEITDNTVGAAELNVSGNGTSGQALLSDGDGTFSWGSAGIFSETSSGVYSTASLTSVTVDGDFIATGDITSNSDERLKDNITTIESALSKVNSLRGVEFDKNGSRHIGLIAQEVQKIIPEVVSESSDEMKTLSVAYGNIVGLLVEAIKELSDKVDSLTK